MSHKNSNKKRKNTEDVERDVSSDSSISPSPENKTYEDEPMRLANFKYTVTCINCGSFRSTGENKCLKCGGSQFKTNVAKTGWNTTDSSGNLKKNKKKRKNLNFLLPLKISLELKPKNGKANHVPMICDLFYQLPINVGYIPSSLKVTSIASIQISDWDNEKHTITQKGSSTDEESVRTQFPVQHALGDQQNATKLKGVSGSITERISRDDTEDFDQLFKEDDLIEYTDDDKDDK